MYSWKLANCSILVSTNLRESIFSKGKRIIYVILASIISFLMSNGMYKGTHYLTNAMTLSHAQGAPVDRNVVKVPLSLPLKMEAPFGLIYGGLVTAS